MHCSQGQPQSIEITVEPHGGIRGRCSRCRRLAPGYDRLPQRRCLFVPLWGIPTDFRCLHHGERAQGFLRQPPADPALDKKRFRPGPAAQV